MPRAVPLYPTSDAFPLLRRHLDTEGTGTGSHDANVDGSITPQTFRISPPSSGFFAISQLVCFIEDAGNFTTLRYGALPELTTGLTIGFFDTDTGALVTDYTAAHKIKTNADWAMFAWETALNTWGGGDSHFVARWNITHTGTRIILPQGGDVSFGVRVSDDLTGLTAHEFIVEGHSGGNAAPIVA